MTEHLNNRPAERHRDPDVRPFRCEEQSNYHEETAAEISNPLPINRESRSQRETKVFSGSGIFALIFAVFSLFYSPLFFGIISILLGLFARRKEAGLGIGTWAIGISLVSIVISLFVAPYV